MTAVPYDQGNPPTYAGPWQWWTQGAAVAMALSVQPVSAGPEEHRVPEIRAFRALRYDPDLVGDMSLVVCPPYDIIGPEQQERLLEAHPCNAVRLDLPEIPAGEEPEERYRRAARTLAAWRSDGTLRRDPYPSIYVYEQAYTIPGSAQTRTQRGFFGRLRLEPFGPGSGVLPHERTLAAPKEDRYKLLRATAVNTSPVVGMYADPGGGSVTALAAIAAGPSTVEVTDEDVTRHRLWVVPEDGPAAESVRRLLEAAGRHPITIADGHHRYETALRYRDERRASNAGETDPAFDFVLMLFLEITGQRLTVLPTHRLVRSISDEGAAALLAGAHSLFDVQPVADRAVLAAAFASVDVAPGGKGRFGLWTRAGGAVLHAHRDALEPYLPQGGAALRGLDVTVLQAALEHLCGIDAAAIAAGRLAYTKSVAEALDWVEAGHDGADAAFLLDSTPVAAIAAVASDGDVMPQKSTYFFPKALSGMIINPLEW
jgi:uncharacterized protein (DUF1015 family)